MPSDIYLVASAEFRFPRLSSISLITKHKQTLFCWSRAWCLENVRRHFAEHSTEAHPKHCFSVESKHCRLWCRSEPIENEDNERVSDLEEEIKLCRHVAVSLHWELQSADEKCQKVFCSWVISWNEKLPVDPYLVTYLIKLVKSIKYIYTRCLFILKKHHITQTSLEWQQKIIPVENHDQFL